MRSFLIPLIDSDNYFVRDFHPAEMELYRDIVENLRRGIVAGDYPLRGIGKERMIKIAHAVDFGCPEFFFLGKSISFAMTGECFRVEFERIYPLDQIAKMWKRLEEKIDDIIYELSLQEDDVGRILQLNRWFRENCSTQGYATETNGNAYTTLVEGGGRCEGIAKAAQLILRRLDFRCLLCYGTAGGERHAWNIVGFRNRWYGFDFTWNIGAYSGEEYLFCPDDFFSVTHAQDTKFVSGYPVCDDDRYSFWKRFQTEIFSPEELKTHSFRKGNGKKYNLFLLRFRPSAKTFERNCAAWLPEGCNRYRYDEATGVLLAISE